jgi:hypothetical protein
MTLLLLGAGPGARTTGGGGGGGPPPGTWIGLWDASVTSSLALSGSDVSTWADQSGNGNTMTWSLKHPTYSAAGFNTSFPAVSTDATGTSSSLSASSFPMGTGNTMTAFVVSTMGTATSQSDARWLSYFGTGTSSDFGAAGSWCINRTSGIQFTRNGGSVTGSASADPAPHVFIVTVDSSGVMTLYVDGISAGTITRSGNWISGGALCIGTRAPGVGSYITAPFAHVGVSTLFTNSTDVATLYNFLKTKWGL